VDVLLGIVANIRIIDILDILIVTYIFYKLLTLLKDTRAEQLIKGIILIIIASKVSELLKLYMVNYILKNTLTVGALALLIVFQPELRRTLEHIGRSKLFAKSFEEFFDKETDYVIDEIMKAVENLSRNKIGALIVIERETGLNDIIETGFKIDSRVISEFILNIFTPNTPLHDGAIIVRNERIIAAGCLLPLSNNSYLNKELGTRHRAALGMIENSDAVVVVVSEETGIISVAINRDLKRYLDVETTRKLLKNSLMEKYSKGLNIKKWWVKNGKKV